ncbi:hypothetical protein MTO96_037620 [Rhipicephalus appendiculatus]
MWDGGAVNRDRRSALCPGHGQPSLVRPSCPGQLRGQRAQRHPDQYLTVEDRRDRCQPAPLGRLPSKKPRPASTRPPKPMLASPVSPRCPGHPGLCC